MTAPLPVWDPPYIPGPGPRGRALGRLTAAVVVVLLAAAAAAVVLSALQPAGSAGPARPGRPHFYAWPGGRAPAGITLSGLEDYVMGPRVVTMMDHQIGAARYFWRVRMIRLQVLQDRLVGPRGRVFNRWYMFWIRSVVRYALGLHLRVVLNDQTEVATGYAADEPLPDHATRVFWGRMMAAWANNPHVVFDLFNEPRLCTWAQWRAATQPLVTWIRARARNQIWVEGINWASTLGGVPLLHGTGIVYTFHHPGSPHPSKTAMPSPAIWYRSFGYLAAEGVPVVDAEFANYIGNYDWDDHPGRFVRAYLAYLDAHHIGMLAWSLVPGSLNSSYRYDSLSHEPQGDGRIIRAWFAREAR